MALSALLPFAPQERALFVIAPRPHIASDKPGVDFNLIRGERKLEGIQDMFLVVYVPKRLGGLCLQASLDTGHDVEDESGAPLVLHRDPDRHRNGEDEPRRPRGGGTSPPDGGPDEAEETYLVINIEQFARPGILTKGLIQVLRGAGVTSVADLFRRDHPTIERLDRHQLVAARAVLNHVTQAARQPK
jgi:hypothetical protein